jgi:chorismate synthase
MGNNFGRQFRITTFGESHGKAIGVTIDGCPAGLELDELFIQEELDRRKPGQSKITTQRKEGDKAEILSGVFAGKTTGTPIAMVIYNQDQKSKDYNHIADKFRPSHADYTYHEKYGNRDYRGGGRSSARETAARVAAGAVAKLMLREIGVDIQAYVSQAGKVRLEKHYSGLDLSKTESNIVRCPDEKTADEMIELIDQTRKNQDTIGGVVSCIITGTPVGLGEPVFDKLHAELGKAMLSINAVKGFEYGSGFAGVEMIGSEHNDIFEKIDGKIVTHTNYSGGIQGGISNGQDIYFQSRF